MLIGASGAGKSTLARTWPASQVLSLDGLRGVVSDDPGRQDATADAADVLKLILERDVLATVGPLNSTVAESTQKTYADHDLVQVSPSADYPALTLGKNWWSGAKKRPYDTFFSLQPDYFVQGPAAAEYLRREGRTNAYVMDDNLPYSTALTTAFTERFKDLGGTVSGQYTTDLGQTNFARRSPPSGPPPTSKSSTSAGTTQSSDPSPSSSTSPAR